jgi:hypothetical protein
LLRHYTITVIMNSVVNMTGILNLREYPYISVMEKEHLEVYLLTKDSVTQALLNKRCPETTEPVTLSLLSLMQ